MSRLLVYIYFLLAIALFEAIFGLSLQSIGSLIAYNLFITVTAFSSGLLYLRETSGKANLAGVILLGLTLLKLGSIIHDLPIIVDAVIDSLIVIILIAMPIFYKASKIAYVSLLLAILGSCLVILKIDPYTLTGGLILEASAALLAASHIKNLEYTQPNSLE